MSRRLEEELGGGDGLLEQTLAHEEPDFGQDPPTARIDRGDYDPEATFLHQDPPTAKIDHAGDPVFGDGPPTGPIHPRDYAEDPEATMPEGRPATPSARLRRGEGRFKRLESPAEDWSDSAEEWSDSAEPESPPDTAPGVATVAHRSAPPGRGFDRQAPPTALSLADAIEEEDDLIGAEVGGCRILSRLGHGGMATVYLARQLDLDRNVAVKVLSRKLTWDPHQVEQFVNEARTLARLEHPNVVHVYGVGETEGIHYVVLELVEGGTLKDLLDERGHLPSSEASDLLGQMAQGLLAAHQAGVVHRDVKPGNVLVSQGRLGLTAKITDFGLALMQDDPALAAGQLAGTPLYMSPEQADARPVDQRSDIYSLGATFYHLLTGQPPFRRDSLSEILLAHVNAPLQPPNEVVDGVPQRVAATCCRMLAKAPERRYANLGDLLEDLHSPGDLTVSPELTAAPPARPVPEVLLDAREHLPSITQTLGEPEAEHTRGVFFALVAGAALATVVAVFHLDAISTVVSDLSRANPTLESSDEVVAREDLAQLRRRGNLDGPQGVVLLRGFAAQHSGTSAASEASSAADALEARLEEAARQEARDRLDQAWALLRREEYGAALDGVRALDAPARRRAGEESVARLERDAHSALTALGLAWVPTGTYPTGEGGRRVSVELTGFYVALREVTCEDYAAFLARQPARAAPGGWTSRRPPEGSEKLPVTRVTWGEAVAYASWRGGRLPTAPEWEAAARGFDGRRWPWGDEADPTRCNWAGAGPGRPQAVGSRTEDVSPWGCLDMAGNVSEMTLVPGWTAENPRLWLRGGSWATRSFPNTRGAFFRADYPADLAHPGVGFRVVSDLPLDLTGRGSARGSKK
jgi:serine/threonine protein kinase/formylglycine-generating enzyme required for sulfatase activity